MPLPNWPYTPVHNARCLTSPWQAGGFLLNVLRAVGKSRTGGFPAAWAAGSPSPEEPQVPQGSENKALKTELVLALLLFLFL